MGPYEGLRRTTATGSRCCLIDPEAHELVVLTVRKPEGTVDDMVITRRLPTAARSRITAQGQITVPKAIRDSLDVGPGDELEFEPMGDGYVIRPRRRRSILDFAGIAGRASANIPGTTEELDRLIDEGMAREALRGL